MHKPSIHGPRHSTHSSEPSPTKQDSPHLRSGNALGTAHNSMLSCLNAHHCVDIGWSPIPISRNAGSSTVGMYSIAARTSITGYCELTKEVRVPCVEANIAPSRCLRIHVMRMAWYLSHG